MLPRAGADSRGHVVVAVEENDVLSPCHLQPHIAAGLRTLRLAAAGDEAYALVVQVSLAEEGSSLRRGAVIDGQQLPVLIVVGTNAV